MNRLLLVIPTDLKQPKYIQRMLSSVDISEFIDVIIVNQSENSKLSDFIQLHTAQLLKEIQTNGLIPLSKARNLALQYAYKNYNADNDEVLTMFVDDDAWFPKETIDYLLQTEIKAYALKTLDPETNKSFVTSNLGEKEIKGWHLISEICSICLVVPFYQIKTNQLFFNEKLGLGNKISQGEESLFIFKLHSLGISIRGSNYLIYHPYKKAFSERNFYSLAYFFAYGTRYVSFHLFSVPFFKNLVKYTIALAFCIKDRRYFLLFKNVWGGTFDGLRNSEKLLH